MGGKKKESKKIEKPEKTSKKVLTNGLVCSIIYELSARGPRFERATKKV